MEQGQDLGDREAATRLLTAGLAEVLLQFGGIRPREGGAVGEKDPMAVPAALVLINQARQ